MASARILFVLTSSLTARVLMRGQLRHLRSRGFDVSLACGGGDELEHVAEREGVPVHRVPLRREIHPLQDLLALMRLIAIIRRIRPDAVVAGTPKAGVLGMLAARICRTPVRIYTLRGLRIETVVGWKRSVLKRAEKVAGGCATVVVAVSRSLADVAIASGLHEAAKVRILGAGSSNGVDTDRFRPPSAAEREAARAEMGIERPALVVGFVGRLTRDKGVEDLVLGFRDELADRAPAVRLVLVGEHEHGDPVSPRVREMIEADPRIVRVGFVDDPARAYHAFDVLALPSYREGFPNAPLEAAASGLPVAAYACTGTVDAVVDGETGTLVTTGDRTALMQALARYAESPQTREAHGRSGRERAVEWFRNETVWTEWASFLEQCLSESRNRPRGSA